MPGVILAVILCIFAVLLLVTRCGSSSDGVGLGGPAGGFDARQVLTGGAPPR